MLEASLLSHEHFYIKSYTFYENEFEINLQFDMHFNEEKVEQIGEYNYTISHLKFLRFCLPAYCTARDCCLIRQTLQCAL